ncbi:hypothetical protein HDU91_001727, partial [Kappamyces sp. JEL0680]
MGGSGAGKSTLLNTLAGRIANTTNLSPDSEILVDGLPRDPNSWNLQCAYVEQDDILFRNLTVFETLLYSARLRLPSKYTLEEKIKRVNAVIAQLGLEACRNNRIGDEIKRGISGGERKRVSIGIELVTNPHILFLDEPTSGLDAFNAFNAIEAIKNLAKAEKKIVLLTIHQPRTDILDLFDKVILLSMGKLVWFGPTNDAIEHFQSLGYPLPPKTNPSDFFLDTITVDRRSPELLESSKARIEKFVAAYQELEKKTLMDISKKGGLSADWKHHVNWPSTWAGELFTLLNRFLVNDFRELGVFAAHVGQSVFLVLVMSLLYWQVGNDASGIQNRIGALFFICMNITFGVVMPSINHFPPVKRLIKRERAAGSYRSTSAFMAKVISTLPSLFLSTGTLLIPIYFTVGLKLTVNNFFMYLLLCWVHCLAANNMGLLIGAAVPNVTVGQIVTPMIMIVMMLFGGLLLNLDSIPVFIRWLQYLSLIAYTYKGLAQNEFNSGLVFNCLKGEQCFSTGEKVVEGFSLGDPSMWNSLFINMGLGAGFLLWGLIIFNRTSAPLQ